MEGFVLENILAMDDGQSRSTRSKPVKRKWREIEAIKDRKRLQKELMEMDCCMEYSLDDIKL